MNNLILSGPAYRKKSRPLLLCAGVLISLMCSIASADDFQVYHQQQQDDMINLQYQRQLDQIHAQQQQEYEQMERQMEESRPIHCRSYYDATGNLQSECD